IPNEPSHYGYLSEHHSFGETEEKAGDYAEDLAASMLATVLGVEFDPNTSYDERKEVWRLSQEIVVTRNVTQSAIGDKDGLWTSVVAGAIFAE
ncbi:MAG: pyruvoyl-dependent arginine decarboxylase, partial [Candidatus Binatia bacterium]|nr:pyruvoyl-dependent arginine decarboxylase [Candidatus Binatia bacterium]